MRMPADDERFRDIAVVFDCHVVGRVDEQAAERIAGHTVHDSQRLAGAEVER